MTDISSFYCEASKIPPLGKSDHCCVLLPPNLQLPAPKAYRKSVRPITDSANCSFGQWITCEGWEEVYTTEGAEEKEVKFEQMLLENMNCTSPKNRFGAG